MKIIFGSTYITGPNYPGVCSEPRPRPSPTSFDWKAIYWPFLLISFIFKDSNTRWSYSKTQFTGCRVSLGSPPTPVITLGGELIAATVHSTPLRFHANHNSATCFDSNAAFIGPRGRRCDFYRGYAFHLITFMKIRHFVFFYLRSRPQFPSQFLGNKGFLGSRRQ